jgi:tetratricopeptide (TPR) repeat protein
MGHQAAEAKILGMLSIWYQETGDLKKAEEYLQEALGIQRELEDKESLAKLLVGLGTLYRARGNFQGSRGALEEAQSLTTDQRVGINSHLELGRLFHVQGKLVEARAEILLALNMTRHTEWVNERADCCRELARIAQESGNLAESMEFYRRAYALYEDYGYRAKAMATMEEMRAER